MNTVQRFAPQMRSVVTSVYEAFHRVIERDDVEQEAMILTATYAGELPGWHSGKLTQWEACTEDGEAGVRALYTATLRGDLAQVIGRQVRACEESLERLASQGFDIPGCTTAEDILDRLRTSYPTLVLHVVDNYTLAELSNLLDTSTSTVKRRLVTEKEAFMLDYDVDSTRSALGLPVQLRSSKSYAGTPQVEAALPEVYENADTYHGRYVLSPEIRRLFSGICDPSLLRGEVGERVA